MALTARIRRGLKGGAKATTLSGSVAAGATSIVCADLSTWSGATTNGPSTATINRGQSDEETVGFTGISTNTLTGVSRGEAGTSDQSHSSGTIELTTSKIDADEANELVAAMALNSVRVYSSAAIGMAHNTSSAIPFDSERFDGNTMHSTSFTTSRLTCRVAGKYHIYAHVRWVGSATGIRQISLTLNGTTDIAAATVAPSGTQSMNQSLGTIYSLAVNDYVEVTALQDSGSLLNIYAAGNVSPEFGMQFVGF